MACVGVTPRAAVVVALGLMLAGLPGSAGAQPGSTEAKREQTDGGAGPLTDPERVRRALERSPSGLLDWSSTLKQVDGTTFRVTVTQKAFNIWDFWGPPETAVAPYVRSWYFSSWHAEYLRMVTPEAGRRAALYPTGMLPIMPAIQAVVSAIKDAARARAERQAKEEVQEALEQFFREHPEARTPPPSAPDKPPLPPQ